MAIERNALAGMAQAAQKNDDRPSVGRTVTIIKGRKHKNKTGIVKRHMVNKFYDMRYRDNAMRAWMEMKGREGYTVLVETSTGETFFVPAEYTEVHPK